MSRCQQVGRPILQSLRQATGQTPSIAVRHFASTSRQNDDATTISSTTQPGSQASKSAHAALLSPKTVATGSPVPTWTEEQLTSLLSPEHGSRRRRAALATSGNIPFEQLPYQCFQEARKILSLDREEKVAQIAAETAKIKRLEAADPSTMRGGEPYKQKRLESLRKHVEELKVLADINDPSVKRRFEDGMGDMSKPVYRFLANRKWRAMDHKIIVQRINQFNIVPDILPKFEPTMDVKLSFRGYPTPPGAVLDSRMTEVAPALRMQVFDKGERLLSIAIMDPDVPDVESDGFKRRCHFLAANIPWDPTKNQLALRHIGSEVAEGSLAVPWLPPFAQLGAPYHRLTVFVMEQADGKLLDAEKLKELYNGEGRENFGIKSFRDKFGVTPVGFNMFRTVWDENTAGVMERHGIPGADIEFRRTRVMTLKTPRKAKGWEAKRQKPKFRSLWKYTKRIA
ncbi:phosphatidylethanolamine-binding protein [Podospora didyma]|uniref:Large ribosomal subunit protein mL38 n=1 Tax=Podospora didyma TaxID=330526 RepID=A0AAE0NCD8_9PEZI|nr:phosphatidylethanolamine-binding protein [Podospora didyma]